MNHILKFDAYFGQINESNEQTVLNNKSLVNELLDTLRDMLPSDIRPGDDLSDYIDSDEEFDVISNILDSHNITLQEDDIYYIMSELNDIIYDEYDV